MQNIEISLKLALQSDCLVNLHLSVLLKWNAPVVQGSHPNQAGHLFPEVPHCLSHQEILGSQAYPEEQDINTFKKSSSYDLNMISLGYKYHLNK